jgi:hypothetical protein
MRQTAFPIGRGSTLLAERRFYDNTFLKGDDGGTMLFILDAALVRGPSGRERLRTKRDVIGFPDEASMLNAVTGGGWVEAPLDGKPRWKPTVADLGGSEEAEPYCDHGVAGCHWITGTVPPEYCPGPSTGKEQD